MIILSLITLIEHCLALNKHNFNSYFYNKNKQLKYSFEVDKKFDFDEFNKKEYKKLIDDFFSKNMRRNNILCNILLLTVQF